MRDDGIARLRQDVSDLTTAVAGLNDAIKYMMRGDAETAEEKRKGAERRIFRIVERY